MGGSAPSGGLSRLMSGIGNGIGNLVSGFWMNTMGRLALVLSTLNDSASTLLWASIPRFSAGCGTPSLISGPQ
ncbi:hypothetical protein D3C81_1709310 [compost metagenome]